MSHGQRSSMLRNSRGKDYWSKVDKVFGPVKMYCTSHKAGTNKLTKRYTHKSIRQKVRAYINSL